MALWCPIVGDSDMTMSLDLTKSIDSEGAPLPEAGDLCSSICPSQKKITNFKVNHD